MAQIELAGEEADVVREVLARHLNDLRVEIRHTFHRAYREGLEARAEVVEAVLRRLGKENAVPA